MTSMAATSMMGEQRVIIDQVRWSTYLALLEDADNRRGRMTYDQGVLEIMSPSMSHENLGRLIGRMVEAFTEERGIEIVSVASMTVKLEALQRGFEADEAYYITRSDQVRGKEELDFAIDPAPDLVIEVDISRSSLNKLPVFAAFRIPEYWQYRGDTLRVYCLEGREYREVAESRVLSRFPLDEMRRVLAQRAAAGETELIRYFRNWVREHPVA
jgi:Uma2 family endonuclease